MRSYEGCELNYAIQMLERDGYSVVCNEVRSKKGVDGDTERVIRQRLTDEKTVELCFSRFVCHATYNNVNPCEESGGCNE